MIRKFTFQAVTICAIISYSLTSCSEEVQNENLVQLEQKRDSLKLELKKVGELLSEVEKEIIALDTSESYPLVTLGSLDLKTFEHFFEIHGNVKVEENAMVYPEVNGTINKVLVKEGQNVKKGDPLIKIDSESMISNIKELETSLELATKVFNKQATLWEDSIGSEMDYLKAKNNKESLEQKLKTAQTQLDMYTVRAPFSGIVDEIMPKVGESANPAMAVLRIINLSKVYVEADVSEKYLNRVKEGSLVKINFPELEKEYTSKIQQVGNHINPANRTFKVRVLLNNNNGLLKPNLLAVLNIRDFVKEDAIVIPSKAVQLDRSGDEYFYTLKSEGRQFKVIRKDITTGLSNNNELMITSGVDSIINFINKGARSVKAGDIVEVAK